MRLGLHSPEAGLNDEKSSLWYFFTSEIRLVLMKYRLSVESGDLNFFAIRCCNRYEHFETTVCGLLAMYFRSRHTRFRTTEYFNGQRSSSLLDNFCISTRYSLWNSFTCNKLAYFFPSTSCTINQDWPSLKEKGFLSKYTNVCHFGRCWCFFQDVVLDKSIQSWWQNSVVFLP